MTTDKNKSSIGNLNENNLKLPWLFPPCSSEVHLLLLFFGLLLFNLAVSSCETFREGTDHKSSCISAPHAAAEVFFFSSACLLPNSCQLCRDVPTMLLWLTCTLLLECIPHNCIKLNAAPSGILSQNKTSAHLQPRSHKHEKDLCAFSCCVFNAEEQRSRFSSSQSVDLIDEVVLSFRYTCLRFSHIVMKRKPRILNSSVPASAGAFFWGVSGFPTREWLLWESQQC